jgi:hypothetical protein
MLRCWAAKPVRLWRRVLACGRGRVFFSQIVGGSVQVLSVSVNQLRVATLLGRIGFRVPIRYRADWRCAAER